MTVSSKPEAPASCRPRSVTLAGETPALLRSVAFAGETPALLRSVTFAGETPALLRSVAFAGETPALPRSVTFAGETPALPASPRESALERGRPARNAGRRLAYRIILSAYSLPPNQAGNPG
jgi:hypothetical protein